MRTRILTLSVALSLVASAAAGAAGTAAAPAAAAAAPAASAAPAAAPAAASAAGAARGAFSGGGGGERFGGGGGGGWAAHGSFGGARGGGWAGQGSYGGVRSAPVGGAGMVGRGTVGGIRSGGGDARGMAMARGAQGPVGGSVGYHFIAPNRGGSAISERGVRSPHAWAPGAGSAAHAVRVLGGLQQHGGREVRQVRPVAVRPVDRAAQLPKIPPGPYQCLGGGPDWTCPTPGYGFAAYPAPQYCVGYYGCPAILIPQQICVERDSAGHYRYFQCAGPVKMGVRN